MTCACPLGETHCYTDPLIGESGQAYAVFEGGAIVWRDVASNVVIDAQRVRDCLGCQENPMLAEDTPWVLGAALPGSGTNLRSATATKTLPNGVIITATVRNPTLARSLSTGGPSGATDPNALTLLNPNDGAANGTIVDFTCTVFQPATRVRIIDMDSKAPPGPFEERAYLFGEYRTAVPDSMVGFQASATGQAGGLVRIVDGADTYFRAPRWGAERSARIAWDNVGWGPTKPFTVRYSIDVNNTGGRASQYDFFGPIVARNC